MCRLLSREALVTKFRKLRDEGISLKSPIFYRILLVNLLVLSTAFIVFVSDLVPPKVTEWHIGRFTITTHGFNYVNIFIYYLSLRVQEGVVILAAFLMSKRFYAHGWMALLVYQVYRTVPVIDSRFTALDEWEWLIVLPLALVVVISLYWLRHKIHHRANEASIVNLIIEQIDDKEQTFNDR